MVDRGQVKTLLHSWYRFRANVAPISQHWAREFPTRMFTALSRFPYPEVALFFETEKYGVLSMLLFNRRALAPNEWDLVEKSMIDVTFNAFCTLQMFKGEICDSCPVHLSGAVPVERQFDKRFGRCRCNEIVGKIVGLVRNRRSFETRTLWEVRTALRADVASREKMRWNLLLDFIKTELRREGRKEVSK